MDENIKNDIKGSLGMVQVYTKSFREILDKIEEEIKEANETGNLPCDFATFIENLVACAVSVHQFASKAEGVAEFYQKNQNFF